MAHYDEQREQHDRENQSSSAGSTAEYDFYMAQALCSLEKAKQSILNKCPITGRFGSAAEAITKHIISQNLLMMLNAEFLEQVGSDVAGKQWLLTSESNEVVK